MSLSDAALSIMSEHIFEQFPCLPRSVDHGGGLAVPGDDDAAVLSLQAVHDLRRGRFLTSANRRLLRHSTWL